MPALPLPTGGATHVFEVIALPLRRRVRRARLGGTVAAFLAPPFSGLDGIGRLF